MPRARIAIAYTAGLTGLTVMALVRQSGVPATQTMWAEDGRIFYSQALRLPFWQTLLVLHDGYAQLFPRLAIQIARLLPVGQAAEVPALAGAISVAALACGVFHVARGHIVSARFRALFVAAMVLLPVAGTELLDNLVNVPWWLFFATFWVLLWRPQSVSGRAGAALICLLAAASEPLVALFLPLSGARYLALGRPADQAASAGLLVGLLYQATAILNAGAKLVTGPSSLSGIGQSFAVRAGLGLLGGAKGTNWLLAHHRTLSVALGVVIVCAILAAGFLTGPAPVRAFTAVCIGFSAVCFVVPVWLRGVAGVMQSGTVEVASRYEAVPLLLLISAVLAIADQFARQDRAASLHRRGRALTPPIIAPRRSLTAAAVCAALLAPAWVIDFRDPNQRSAGPRWGAQVTTATTQCRRSPSGTVSLAIDPPGWTAAVPCRDLVPPKASP